MANDFEFRDAAHGIRICTAQRGWVTRRIQLLAGSVGALETSPRSALARSKVTTDLSSLDESIAKANDAYDAFTTFEDATDAEHTRMNNARDAMNGEATTARTRAVTAMAAAEAADAPAPGPPPAPAPAPAPPPLPTQSAAALRPPTLLSGSSPASLKSWLRKFKAYFSQLGAAAWPVDSGHALLSNCIDGELWSALERSQTFNETAPVIPLNPPTGESLLELLDLHFVAENPVFNRRVAWHQITQSPGQASSLVVSKVREEALLADIDSLTFDETLVLRTMCAITDKELLSELRRLPTPITFRHIQDRCLAYDREKKEASSSKQAKAATTSASSQGQSSSSPSSGQKTGPRQRQQIPPSLIGRCTKCGQQGHSRPACPKPVSDLNCTYCSKTGHLEPACFSKARAAMKAAKSAAAPASQPQQLPLLQPPPPIPHGLPPPAFPTYPPSYVDSFTSDPPPSTSSRASTCAMQASRVSRVCTMHQSQPTPKVLLTFSQGGSSFHAKVTPDTGTTLTVMSSSFLPKLFSTTSSWHLEAADGRKIDSSREAIVRISRRGSPSVEILVLFSNDLPAGEVLLSWTDQIKIGLLHPEWPDPPPSPPTIPAVPPFVAEAAALANIASGSSHRSTIRSLSPVESMIQEFPDVLDDNLTADKRMIGDPLHIRFKPGEVHPYHATNARPVAAHLEAPGRALCAELEKRGHFQA